MWAHFQKINLVLGVPAGSIAYSVTTSVVETYLLNHGLRTPNEAFFTKIQEFWAGADKFWDIWGIFLQSY